MAAGRAEGAGTGTLIILAVSATAGYLVEVYDFFIYGYAAASAFPAIFFPNLPPTQALVFSYLAFGAGFPARSSGHSAGKRWQTGPAEELDEPIR